MKDTFVLYTKYIDSIEYLTREERGDLFTALLAYSAERELPEMDGASKAAFGFIKTQIDIDNAKYSERCAKNKENAEKKRKTGTSKRSVANGSDRKRSVAIDTDGKRSGCDSDSDSDNDSDNDNALKKQSIKEKSAIADKEKPDYYPNDAKLNEAFSEYVKSRKAMKKPFVTDHAVKLAMDKLQTLSGGDNDKAIEIINQSIRNGWLGLFEIKEDSRSGTKDKYAVIDDWYKNSDENGVFSG